MTASAVLGTLTLLLSLAIVAGAVVALGMWFKKRRGEQK